jgi:hypothetical protein
MTLTPDAGTSAQLFKLNLQTRDRRPHIGAEAGSRFFFLMKSDSVITSGVATIQRNRRLILSPRELLRGTFVRCGCCCRNFGTELGLDQ